MSDTTAEEIAEARADFDSELLPDEATILRAVEESDGGGGRTAKEWRARETVPCRLDPYGGATSTRGAGGESTAHAGERIESRISHLVTLPAETDVELLDRLEINGGVYEVNVLRQRGAFEFTRMVEVKERF
jgi:hypothetical protein